MSAATSMAREVRDSSRRAFPRHPIDVPLDVIILRSGIPDTLPGRCTDLSEVGVGAVIAGDLTVGSHLALEMRLPEVAEPVRARALVRHGHHFRYGLQFVGLAADQREMIRYWALHNDPGPNPRKEEGAIERLTPGSPAESSAGGPPTRPDRRPRRRWIYPLLALALALAAAAFWRWQRGWNDLEGPVQPATVLQHDVPVKVASASMEQGLLYKVEPVYPETARRAGIEGVVTLDAIIGLDGTVERLRPLSGPDLLTQAAIDAVQSWRFQPYRQDGKAVTVETTIAVAFQLK